MFESASMSVDIVAIEIHSEVYANLYFLLLNCLSCLNPLHMH